MLIVGIDPASIGNVGVAYLHTHKNGKYSIEFAHDAALDKTKGMIGRLRDLSDVEFYYDAERVFIEESHIRAKGNDAFQRAIGALSYASSAVNKNFEPTLIPAVRVKSFFGAKDKIEVGQALKEYLVPSSQELLKDLLAEEKYNATDAIAVAVAGMELLKQQQQQKESKIARKKNKTGKAKRSRNRKH